MDTLLPKLRSLQIWGSPEIDSFPEGGLPLNLISLSISNCEKLLSGLSSIGVHERLDYLEFGGASSASFKSFPKEDSLPKLPSLTSLQLIEFDNLETLQCKGLLHLTSLQYLTIDNCPRLENVAGERLPPSLINLIIYGCPLLEEPCNMKNPQIWPKICHIPNIVVNRRSFPGSQQFVRLGRSAELPSQSKCFVIASGSTPLNFLRRYLSHCSFVHKISFSFFDKSIRGKIAF